MKWVDPLLHGFRRLTTVRIADLPQSHQSILAIELLHRDRLYRLCIDYDDRPSVDERSVEGADLYFKMQYARGGYAWPHVVPGGFVPAGEDLYHHLERLRRVRTSGAFETDVYGRFGLEFRADVRRRAVEMLSSQRRIAFSGDLRKVRYTRSLQEVARARVCIDMPGNGDFCFRLVDYLAVGSCVVGPPLGTVLHAPLVDGVHVVHCREDLADLVDTCAYYVAHDEERERIASNAREFFDRYLHRDQLARYYLWRCHSHLVVGASDGREASIVAVPDAGR